MATQTAPRPRRLVNGGNPDALPKVPASEYFGEADYADSTMLDTLVGDLIEACAELRFLHQTTIKALWRAKGGKSKGKPVLGKVQAASGLLGFFCPAEWVLWIAADHAAEMRLTAWQLEACVFHELLHFDEDVDDETGESKITLRAHDFEGFGQEVERYGAWELGLQGAARHFEQLTLPTDDSDGE